MKEFVSQWLAPAGVALVVSLIWGFVRAGMVYDDYLHEHEQIVAEQKKNTARIEKLEGGRRN